MGGANQRPALAAACLLLAIQLAVAAPGPGKEPGPGGGVRCQTGYFKATTGNYKCHLCPANTIAPGTGHTKCTACALNRYANSARTYCKKLPPGTPPRKAPKPTHAKPTHARAQPTNAPKPKPQPTLSAAAATKRAGTVYHPSQGCRGKAGGSKECGIPIGYAGNPIGYQGLSRTGSVLYPPGYQNRALPVMILLHGSGVNGDWMIRPFINFAVQYKFIIVAPDSRNDEYWENPNTNKDPYTQDWYHIEACYTYVAKQPNVRVLKGSVTVNGNSRAGYTAPAIASRSTAISATSAIIMHANVLPKQMGYRVFPILWSTGERDPLYGPKQTNVNRAYFHHARPEYPITYRVWQSGHPINNASENSNICQWFVDPRSRSNPAPYLG